MPFDRALAGSRSNGVSGMQHLGVRERQVKYPATQLMLLFLSCDCDAEHRSQRPASDCLLPVFYSMVVIGVVLLWSLAALILVVARWIDPPTTAVQIQRHLQAWIQRTPYRKRYTFIPLSQISADLQHAVIAAEDARFYQHHGFDWHDPPRRRRFGRRSHSWSFHHYPATRYNSILRNGPLRSPKGRGGHTGAGGRIRPRQTAHSGDIPQRGRMGPWYLWCGFGVSLLRRYSSQEYRLTQQAARLAAILPAP